MKKNEESPPNFDYGEYADQPEVDDLKKLSRLAADQVAAEAEVIRCEEELRKAKDALRQINEVQLPEVMDRLKLEQFKTVDGLEIVVDEKIRASITKKNEARAFQWLRDNGHDAIIKRLVSIQFGKDEDAQADKLVEFFQSEDGQKVCGMLNLNDKSSVHAGTLSSLVRSLLEDGEDVPLDILGVFRQRVSKIK
jgi:hypothetical protein